MDVVSAGTEDPAPEDMEQKRRNNPGRTPRSAKRRRRRRATGAPAESHPSDVDRSSATGAEPASVSQTVPPQAGSAQAVGVDAVDGETGAGAPSATLPAPVPAPPPAADGTGAAETACPVCSTTVHDLYTAIAYGDGMAPAHFDCVLSLLGEREELGSGERLCYLGGGSFGIVQVRPPRRKRNGNGGALVIRKRIDFEEREAAPGWRQELRLTFPPPLTAAPGEPEAAPCR